MSFCRQKGQRALLLTCAVQCSPPSFGAWAVQLDALELLRQPPGCCGEQWSGTWRFSVPIPRPGASCAAPEPTLKR